MIPGARLYVALNAMSDQEADRYFEKPFYNKMTEEQQQSFTARRGPGPRPRRALCRHVRYVVPTGVADSI